ncbi:methyltransferase domain-containing protein [Desulfurococcaceae archaeon MEX13E-LK6-19]|nr:methyltransferase domain-containing protein [Desulfurococcaceae archaeon MEX13E-LK6-19]
MKSVYWHLFKEPVDGSDLVFEDEVVGDEWVNGVLKSSSGAEYPVIDDVVVFVKSIDTGWSDELIERIAEEKWIERNWRNHLEKASRGGLWTSFCREIASLNGVILDVASGPGGGFMPCVLYFNDKAKILVNDLEYRILLLWRKFLKNIGRGEYVGYAAFDATNMPIKDGSIDVVVSAGGFSNIPGHEKALREAYRVLKPGGLLYMAEGGILPDDFMKLPADVREKWLKLFPALLGNWASLVEKTGFKILFGGRIGIRELDPEEGDLPKQAAQYGVKLRMAGFYIKAVKPR